MMDDELGRLMVVNKMVYEYCVSEWYFYYIAILKCIISCIETVLCYSHICLLACFFLNYMIIFHICLLSIHFIDISYCCI